MNICLQASRDASLKKFRNPFSNPANIFRTSIVIALILIGLFAISPAIRPASGESVASWNPSSTYPLHGVCCFPGPYQPVYGLGWLSCVTNSNTIYCVGGGNYYTSDVSKLVYYATLSSSGIGPWTPTNNYTIPIRSESCVTSGGYIYCVGGFTNQPCFTPPCAYAGSVNVVSYAPLTGSGVGTWKNTTSYPSYVDSESCVASSGDIYCVGGENNSIASTSVYYATLSSSGVGPWSLTTNYPLSIVSESCVPSTGDIYCVGGDFGNGTSSDSVYYATPSGSGVGAWSSTTNYPTPIEAQQCVPYSGYAICIDGLQTGYDYDRSAVYFGQLSNTGVSNWIGSTSYPLNLDSFACGTNSNYLYCVGGNVQGGGVNHTFYTQILSPTSTSESTSTTTLTKTTTTVGTSTLTSTASPVTSTTTTTTSVVSTGKSTTTKTSQTTSTAFTTMTVPTTATVTPTTTQTVTTSLAGTTSTITQTHNVTSLVPTTTTETLTSTVAGSTTTVSGTTTSTLAAQTVTQTTLSTSTTTARVTTTITATDTAFSAAPVQQAVGGVSLYSPVLLGILGGVVFLFPALLFLRNGTSFGKAFSNTKNLLKVGLVVSLILGSLITIIPIVKPASAEAVSGWTATTILPYATIDTCFAESNYIYCINNSTADYSTLSSSGIHNWSSTTADPLPNFSACVSSSGDIYCVGANVSNYAPLSGSGIGAWTNTTSYPPALTPASCVLYSGYMYCIGGFNSSINSVFPETNVVFYASVSSSGIGPWSQTTSYPLDLSVGACLAYSGYAYCIGGDNTTGDKVYYASVNSSGVGTWRSTTNYPTSISSQSCTVDSSYVYCVDGSSGTDRDAVYYAPISSAGIGSWTGATSYPIDIHSLSCVSDVYIYCIGGQFLGGNNNHPQQYPTADVYYTGIETGQVSVVTTTKITTATSFTSITETTTPTETTTVTDKATSTSTSTLTETVPSATTVTSTSTVPTTVTSTAPTTTSTETVALSGTTVSTTVTQTNTVTFDASVTATVTTTSTLPATTTTELTTVTDTQPTQTVTQTSVGTLTTTSTLTTTTTITTTYSTTTTTQTTSMTSSTTGARSPTMMSLSCEQYSLVVGRATDCTAIVHGRFDTPTGKIQFTSTNGGSFSGENCVTMSRDNNLVCHVKFTPHESGKITLSANYLGNSNFAPSKDRASIQVFGRR